MQEEDVIQIIEPSDKVLQKAEFYIQLIKKILPNATVTLIGSLAIPVCVKNEMDILIEIDKNEDIQTIQEKVRDESGDIFGIGPIENNEGYSRSKKKHGIICELHILHKDDERIEKYLEQVRRFRNDPELAKKYSDLKRSLNGASNSVYKERKAMFFQENSL